jgi:uncharacterized membrane protein
VRSWLNKYAASFSFVGLISAALFFAASLTPSLIPRNFIVQGLLSGFAATFGYGLGVFRVWLWHYFELPEPGGKYARVAAHVVSVSALAIAFYCLWRAPTWQNSTRELMEMDPVVSGYPFRVSVIAGLLIALLIAGARLFWRICQLVAENLNRYIPRRISLLLGLVTVGAVLFLLVNGVLLKYALRSADQTFVRLDAYIEEGIAQPVDANASGSTASLISWETIGRQGKNFIVTGPTQEIIRKFSGRDALAPLRVYVGLGTKETDEARAKLALEELKRIGAFDRSILVVATPTGTGWLEPGAVDSIEYLHLGDTAIVSMQYSYLPSWMTILIEPDRSSAAAQALFKQVYGYWTTLPKDKRPKFYLHGLSLGALGSEVSTDFLLIMDDMIQGAVWSGPPFPSKMWIRVNRDRKPNTPVWLPKFGDGSLVRFTGRENALKIPDARWGSVRIVYIQHASDPMTFFSQITLFKKPQWLNGKRGPDVSPHLRWYPIITFLQTAFDLAMSTNVPAGYGHNISAASYIDAWVEVTAPADWTPDDISRLKRALKE